MSGIKRYMEALEHQLDVGRQIAIEAGVLKICEYHDVAYYTERDKTPAYILGNKKFTAGEVKGVFDDRTEMTDAILKAIEDSATECYYCEKWSAE